MTEVKYNIKAKIESKEIQELSFKDLNEEQVKTLFSILSRNYVIHEFKVIENILDELPFK